MSAVTETSRPTSNFAELSRSECEKLLAEHSVGRVGLAAPNGPQILPVTYAYHGKTVVFRTSPYGLLSSLERHTRVAFESTTSMRNENRAGACWCWARRKG
jgi:nitroimidazol reductase NimA-like FMN-containing flavoprotein (pyridoxamine 5'-phosphate oxidase superfamily)